MSAGGSNVLMTLRETAEYLNVNHRTLEAQWRAWDLPAHRVGRGLRFRVRDVEHWLDQNKAA